MNLLMIFFERGLSGDHDFLGASVYYFITVIYVYPLGICIQIEY